MEALDLSEAADESSGASGAVKSEDGSPTHGTGRGSPPPNCAICLGRCRNKSFTDSCLHQFCFKCLLTWSRVKTECPLCKQNFKSIIHNVKSNHQYEEYPVQQTQVEQRPPSMDFSEIVNSSRFRYRTTLTLPRRETLAIRQFLLHYPLAAVAMSDLPRERDRRNLANFRRTVYRHNLWARHLPDFTGRFRDCSPEFFRQNDSQVHRLVPWLNRELFYLLNENSAHVTYVMGRILELLPVHSILSPEFRSALHRYLGEHTDHFLHEFHCFASTPYDITGYDRHVQYGYDTRASPLYSEVLSSSDSDSHDSDIVMVSSSRAATPPRAPPPPAPTVIPIETISHSDSGSDSEVMLVGYVKPPHQRTPELVDLASDSDVVVQEEEAPPPAPEALVRFQLSVRPAARPAPPRPRRRDTTSDSSYAPSTLSPCTWSTDSGSASTTSQSKSESSDVRRRRTRHRKSRRKTTRHSRSDARSPRRDRDDSRDASAEGSCRSKGKSRNGKDVKSSESDVKQVPIPEVSGTSNESDTTKEAKLEPGRRESSELPERNLLKKKGNSEAGPSGERDRMDRHKGKSRNGKDVKTSAPDVKRVPIPEVSRMSNESDTTKEARPELDRCESTELSERNFLKKRENSEAGPSCERVRTGAYADRHKSRNGKDVKSSTSSMNRLRMQQAVPARPELGVAVLQTKNESDDVKEAKPAVRYTERYDFAERSRAKRRRSSEAGPSEQDVKRKRSAESAEQALERAGPSGVAPAGAGGSLPAGPSDDHKKRRDSSRRTTHDSHKRLKSVVQVIAREGGDSSSHRSGSSGRRRARLYSSSSDDDNIPLRRFAPSATHE